MTNRKIVLLTIIIVGLFLTSTIINTGEHFTPLSLINNEKTNNLVSPAIEDNIWYVGQDVEVDLSFMPIIPIRIEDSVMSSSGIEAWNERYFGSYGDLYNNDASELGYKSWILDASGVAQIWSFYDIFFELQYTDLSTLEYDLRFDESGTGDFSIITLDLEITNYGNASSEKIVDEQSSVVAPINGTGSYPLSSEYSAGGTVYILITTQGQWNDTGVVTLILNIDQLKLTFNNITDSEYHTEYLQETDNDIIHRMFIECPEYNTEIAVDIPTHWVFDRTIPEVDTKVVGNILYLENNTLPVTYEILFTETSTETTHEDSVTSFDETTDDDVMFYPDVSANETITASSGALVGGSETGAYTDTYTDNTVYWKQSLASPGHIGGILNFTHTEYVEQEYGIESGEIYIDIKGNSITNGKVSIYNYATEDWEGHQVLTIDAADHPYTLVLDSDNIESLITRVRYNGTTGGGGGYLWCDYAISTIMPLGCLADSGHYADGFNSINDWSWLSGEVMTSNGDLALKPHDGDGAYRYEQTNDPSVLGGCFIETRFRVTADGVDAYRVYVATLDNYGGTTTRIMNNAINTDWRTAKIYCPQDVETVRFGFATNNASAILQIDYLRIFPANESGWQHDGSTTAGFTESAYADSSTDGDLLNLSATDTVQYCDFWFDNTDTQGNGNTGFYPFFEAKVTDCDSIATTFWIRVYQEDLAAYTDVTGGYTGSTAGIKIWRANLKATITDFFKVRVYLKTAASWVIFDYMKVYSIANYVFTEIDDEASTDYVYVDSGKLVVSSVTTDYIQIDNAILISVDSATYPIWNISLQSGSTNVRFYIGAFFDQGITRGEMPSGISTDYLFRAYGAWSINEINFIAVSNNPTITDVSYTPNPADEDDSVLFTTTLTDSSYPLNVTMNAIEYPSGFSDVDYVYTMESFESWTYNFTTMTAGFYRFLVTANNTLTDTYEISLEITETSTYESHIILLNNLYETISFDTFEVYINGTRQYYNVLDVTEGYYYNITIKNRYGDWLNTSAGGIAAREFVVFINVYSLKFMSWYNNFIELNITRGETTYTEIIMPMEIINFRLYSDTYNITVDYLNGTVLSTNNYNHANSTGWIVTGDSLTDILDLVETIHTLSESINITIQSVNNTVLTIEIDLTNINTTINSQLVYLLLNVTNINSTILSQTVDILAYIASVNTTLYNQTVDILLDISNVNTTLYTQTLYLLSNISNVNTTLYAQTLSIISDISNVNTTLYTQALTVMANIANTNMTLYNQLITQMAIITNVNTTINEQVLTQLIKIFQKPAGGGGSDNSDEVAQSFTIVLIVVCIALPILGGIGYYYGLAKKQKRRKRDRINDVYRTPQ